MTAMTTDPMDISEQRQTPRPGVIERLTQILDVFTTGPEHLLLEDITTLTGLPRSTAFRLLCQLVNLQWLEHDARGYRLGERVHGMTSRRNDHSGVRAAAANALNDLHLTTGAVAHLTVLEGASVHYLDKVGGAVSTTIPSHVGARLPAETTVSGRALLAGLAPERVDALMSVSSDGSPRIDLMRLHAHLNKVRQKHGLAFSPGAKCPGRISAVAAPIIGPSGPVGAISVALRGNVQLDNVAPVVAFAARRTSQMMFPGWKPSRTPRRRGGNLSLARTGG